MMHSIIETLAEDFAEMKIDCIHLIKAADNRKANRIKKKLYIDTPR